MKHKQFSHLPQGHQTLLGAANVIGNGVQILFAMFLVALVVGGIATVF